MVIATLNPNCTDIIYKLKFISLISKSTPNYFSTLAFVMNLCESLTSRNEPST